MKRKLMEARHIRGFELWLTYSDGVAGVLDLSRELDGEVFEPLKDPAVFQQFRIDPELNTLVWPNGADFSPEFLRANIRVDA